MISRLMDVAWQDVRYAWRSLVKTPLFSIAAVATLALGIGANTTIFTLLDAVLFKPLPVANAHELLMLYENAPEAPANAGPDASGGTGSYVRFSYPRFLLFQQALGDRGSMAAATQAIRFVGRTQDTPRASAISTQLVSGLYFSTLGVAMQRGRPLSGADMQRDERAHVAVISDRYWKRVLGGSERTLGQTVVLNDVAVTIVGITQPDFVGARTDTPADMWVPLTLQQPLRYNTNSSAYGADRTGPWIDEDRIAWLNIMARVAPGTQEHARAVLQTANAQGLRRLTDAFVDAGERPAMLAHTLAVEPFVQGFSGLRTRFFSDALFALAAMVAIVLLVTCANIANLLFARATSRSRETGIRLSLGATSGRLVRQHVTESLMLACAGGVASVLLSQWTSALLAQAAFGRSGELPPVFASGSRVWVFAAVLSMATGLAFGLAPALRAIRTGFHYGISVTHRATAHAAMKGMRPLVAGQLALSFAVVFGAVLLGRTLTHFARLDLGFDVDHVVTATIDPATSGYTRDRMPALVERLISSVRSVPGVTSASAAACGLVANCSRTSLFRFEDAGSSIRLQNNWVGPGYFATVGIPLVSGREFTDRDRAESPRVAIISESIARRHFAGRDPIGRQLGFDTLDTEIVAVVRDARSITLHDEPIPMVYFPITQPPGFDVSPRRIDVRVSGDAALAVGAIREAIQRTEPALLLDGVAPMSAVVNRDVGRERLITYLASSFGILALVLACVGLYGVLSYTVTRRTQEIGLRAALGARPVDLTRMVIRDGSHVVLAGIAAGALAAAGVGRLVSTLLTGVSASDPVTYALVGAALGGVSLAACYLPARRAGRINPISALRTE